MEISTELADRVLRHVSSPDYRPSKSRQIAKDLEVSPDDYSEVKRAIKALVHRGQLTYGSNHLILPLPAAAAGASDLDMETVEPQRAHQAKVVRGTFRLALGGFGFVRRGDAGEESVDDVFVPPGATGGALDGDLVEVRLKAAGYGRGASTEGYVDKVLRRGRRQFTGTYEWKDSQALVHLDGVPYDKPLLVGDVRGLPVSNDDKVFVEIVKFPEDDHPGEGVILEVLGKTTNPAIDTLTIMRQFGLPEEFPAEVLEDARARADEFTEDRIPGERRDLRDLLTVTIDPVDARDFDDAISLEKEGGRWTLWVHIADVSQFVRPGSPLDNEAQQRATSVYLPDRVVPMIPEVISNHLASLQPERPRLAKTVEIEMLDDGVVTSVEVYNSVIRSDRRFHYEQIDDFLADPDAKRGKWGEDVCELLLRMHGLAMGMRRRRFKRGSLTLDVPEVKIDLDKTGKVKGAHVVAYTESHQIIEEFMLAANQAVATWLDDQQLNFLHRIHPPPERRKLRRLEQFCKDLRLPVSGIHGRHDIQKVLDSVAGTPLENAVNFSVLQSLSKAVYGPYREGHYALDMEHYCHFTSPIRRYPDLTIHRLVQNIIDGNKTPDESFAVLLRLGFHCSDQERNAAQAERELVQLKLLHFMKKQLGNTIRVLINRVFPDGLLARGVELPVEGFLSMDSLPRDRYHFERRGQTLGGYREGNQFRLGDELSVRIAKVDLRERRLVFEYIKNHSLGKDPLRQDDAGKMPRGVKSFKNKKRGDRDKKKSKKRK